MKNKVYKVYYGDSSCDVGPVENVKEALELVSKHIEKNRITKIELISTILYSD
jgi:hypothetical protein